MELNVEENVNISINVIWGVDEVIVIVEGVTFDAGVAVVIKVDVGVWEKVEIFAGKLVVITKGIDDMKIDDRVWDDTEVIVEVLTEDDIEVILQGGYSDLE